MKISDLLDRPVAALRDQYASAEADFIETIGKAEEFSLGLPASQRVELGTLLVGLLDSHAQAMLVFDEMLKAVLMHDVAALRETR